MMSRNKWESKKLGALGKVVTGTTPPTSEEKYFGGDIPFVTPSDITNRDRSTETERYISKEGREDFESRLLPSNAVCVTCIGATIGKMCMTTEQSLTNQQINSIVVDGEHYDPYYVYYRLQEAAEKFRKYAGGAATPILNKGDFSEIQVTIPPLPVQRRIAGILGAYDDLIENNRRRIELLEEMATAIFQEWFVHYRFPGHADVEMRETEMGEVPDADGWTVQELQEVVTVNRANLRDSNAPEEIHYLTISNVNEGRIDAPETMSWEDSPGRAKRIVQHGDVIWSSVRPYLEGYGLMMHPRSNTIVSTGFAVLTPDEVPYSYLYQYVTTEDFVSYLDKVATGAAYPSANVADFKERKILVPPSDLLERYHEQAAPIYEQINNLRNRNRVLRETRDLLLPRLVSGEVDIEPELITPQKA